MPRAPRSTKPKATPPPEAAPAPAPSYLGPPLRLLADSGGVLGYFEAVGEVIADSLDAPTKASMLDHALTQIDYGAILAGAIAKMEDQLQAHQRAREIVASEAFRQRLASDALLFATSYFIEQGRIDGAPFLDGLGLTSRDDLATVEDRAAAHATLDQNAQNAADALQLYYVDYLAWLAVTGGQPQPEAERAPGRKRHGLKPPTRPLAFPSEPGPRALLYAATQELSRWPVTDEGLRLDTPLQVVGKHPLSIAIELTEQEQPNALGVAVELLPPSEDGTALKTLLALPALFFDHNPEAKYNAVYETTIPDLMRYMGFKPKKGGFERDDQHRVWRAIRLLNRLWVPGVTAHRKRGQGTVVIQQDTWFSPVIVLQGIQHGPQGIALPQAVRYSLGKEFHAYYTGDAGTKTRMLTISPRIMELHGQRDINPLRLAVYYAGQFRINKQGLMHGRESIRVKYATLLEQAGVPIDRKNPARQFKRVVTWHQELAAKGIIGGYDHPNAPPSRSSFSDYAPLLFSVTPPSFTLARIGT